MTLSVILLLESGTLYGIYLAQRKTTTKRKETTSGRPPALDWELEAWIMITFLSVLHNLFFKN